MSTDEKYAAIDGYLCERFSDSNVEQKRDFDRGAQSFKVHRSGRTLLLKVGDEFIADNSVAEILRKLDLRSLAEILGRETELGVLVTRHGLETFDRDQLTQPDAQHGRSGDKATPAPVSST